MSVYPRRMAWLAEPAAKEVSKTSLVIFTPSLPSSFFASLFSSLAQFSAGETAAERHCKYITCLFSSRMLPFLAHLPCLYYTTQPLYSLYSTQCWGETEYMYQCYVFKIQNMSNCILLQLPFKKLVFRIQLLC